MLCIPKLEWISFCTFFSLWDLIFDPRSGYMFDMHSYFGASDSLLSSLFQGNMFFPWQDILSNRTTWWKFIKYPEAGHFSRTIYHYERLAKLLSHTHTQKKKKKKKDDQHRGLWRNRISENQTWCWLVLVLACTNSPIFLRLSLESQLSAFCNGSHGPSSILLFKLAVYSWNKGFLPDWSTDSFVFDSNCVRLWGK